MKICRVLNAHFILFTILICFFLAIAIVSCAPSAKVPVTRPAEINLMGVKRIAIGDIEGNAGTTLSDVLAQNLFESGHYEVLDRQNLNSLMREHNLNLSGAVNEETSAKIGELLGASALIFGRSNAQYRVTNDRDVYTDGAGKKHLYYVKTGEGRLNTTLKVVDLKTGKILAIKNFNEEKTDETEEEGRYPPDPDRDMVLSSLINNTAQKFMKMIAPYVEYVRVEFEKSDNPSVKAGIFSAQSGQWETARAQFKNAAGENPTEAAAWYNLGLANTFTYRYDEAIQAFNKSNGLNPSSKCAKQITTCNTLRAEKRKLEAQLEGRTD